MAIKLSEKLLHKIKDQFPEIVSDKEELAPLRVVRGVDDGCRYKWSNGQVGDLHWFSYSTMKECLDNEIFICKHYPHEGNHGWEIYVK